MSAYANISIMITTKNRAADLRRTLQVLRELNPAPLEILVTADGCRDETVQMVKAEKEKAESRKLKAETDDEIAENGKQRAEMEASEKLKTEMLKAEMEEEKGEGRKQKVESRKLKDEIVKAESQKVGSETIKLIVNEVGMGSVASRDRMMREAQGELVLALDDDSYPEQSDCLARIATRFAKRPKLAIAHFPQRTDEYPATLTQTDFGPEHLTRSFANSGAVLRRSTYLELPGFEPKFFHMYEEPDYALQCLAAGHDVLFTPEITIRHHYSGATRSELRNHQRHSRNEFWGVLLRCPFPQCLGLATYRVFSQFRYACKRGISWVIREPVWWWQAAGGIAYCLRKRQPIPWERYREWLRLT